MLAAASMKLDHPIFAQVIDVNGDSIVFKYFVRKCLDEGVFLQEIFLLLTTVQSIAMVTINI